MRSSSAMSECTVLEPFLVPKTDMCSLDRWEASYYHLGRFYDKHLSQTCVGFRHKGEQGRKIRNRVKVDLLCLIYSMSSQIESILRFTVDNYAKALRYGTKFIYRTLPRMLTIWLDQGARPDIIRAQNQKSSSERCGTQLFFRTMLCFEF